MEKHLHLTFFPSHLIGEDVGRIVRFHRALLPVFEVRSLSHNSTRKTGYASLHLDLLELWSAFNAFNS